MSTCNNILTYVCDCLYALRLIVLDVLDGRKIVIAHVSNHQIESVVKHVLKWIGSMRWKVERRLLYEQNGRME
jgi:hypothetical protein